MADLRRFTARQNAGYAFCGLAVYLKGTNLSEAFPDRDEEYVEEAFPSEHLGGSWRETNRGAHIRV